jgi:hypothetical protein
MKVDRRHAFQSMTGERIEPRKKHPIVGCLIVVGFFAVVVLVGVLGGRAF